MSKSEPDSVPGTRSSERRPHPHDVLGTAREWIASEGRVALATVVGTWGSAPVPIGGQMVMAPDGRFEGSVSGGCVEGEIIAESEAVLADGKSRTMKFGVADDTAWKVGLPCGGEIKVLLERLEGSEGLKLVETSLDARSSRRGILVKTRLDTGQRELYERGDAKADALVREHLETGESGLVATPEGEVFLHALVPPARVLVIGATHIGQILAQLVKIAGHEVIVIDPRTAFAAEARFPGVRLDTEWPQDAIPRIGLDPYTAMVALAHVGHIDDEALKPALRSSCFYIGALGSMRTHAKRTERLLAAGFTPEELKRIHCPVGINIGAQSPPEIAISIMAEIVLALRGPRVFRPA